MAKTKVSIIKYKTKAKPQTKTWLKKTEQNEEKHERTGEKILIWKTKDT
jgi:hypothetical protein